MKIKNNITPTAVNDLFANDTSDHLPIFTVVYNDIAHRNKKETIQIRDLNENNLTKFRFLIAQQNWF